MDVSPVAVHASDGVARVDVGGYSLAMVGGAGGKTRMSCCSSLLGQGCVNGLEWVVEWAWNLGRPLGLFFFLCFFSFVLVVIPPLFVRGFRFLVGWCRLSSL